MVFYEQLILLAMTNHHLERDKYASTYKKGNRDNPQFSGSFESDIYLELKKFIQEKDHPCLAAQSVMHNNALVAAEYHHFGTQQSAKGLARDLKLFLESRKLIKAKFASFIAVFKSPVRLSALNFERLLWRQLRLLHALDEAEWDNTVSSDPEDARFSFSFLGTAFYVVGLHRNSIRKARQFPLPALVFNPHAQFEALREKGHYQKMRDAIRARDKKLQGSLNPMVEDHGLASEAKQYSGRQVDDSWKCPFYKRKL